ncbi:hypothetical protein Scep_026405 [Stephania cephalantha]|uniref:Uncharacterized protein n=1 Tax=Stephania cephalantha TaxID=152367 RepID=A0AAP0HSH6_9MAGN
MVRTKTIEVPKKSEQEKENIAKSEQVGRRAQTTSYRKEKKLRRGVGLSKKNCDLNDGVAATQPSDLAGQQLTIRMSQATAVEPSSSEATESDRGKRMEEESEENTEQRSEKSDENRETIEKMERKVEKEVEVEVEAEVQVDIKMVPLKKKRKEVQVGEMMKKVKVKMEKIPKKKWWNEAVELVNSALNVPEKEAKQQVNKDLKVNKAWLKGKWGCKPTSPLKGKEKKIVTAKALPPRESDKASEVKMADDALKLLTMFGSPIASQPKSKPAEGASSSKCKATPSGPSPLIQKGEKVRK